MASALPLVVACEFWPDSAEKGMRRPGLQASCSRPRPSSAIRGLHRPVLILQAAGHGSSHPAPPQATRSYFTPLPQLTFPLHPPPPSPFCLFLLSASVSHMLSKCGAQPHLGKALEGPLKGFIPGFLSSRVHLLTPMDVLGYIYILGTFRMVQL